MRYILIIIMLYVDSLLAIDKTIINDYIRQCDLGVSKSCFNLGDLYKGNRGINRNYTKAKELFAKACDLDNGLGCVYLGNLYIIGHNVKKDSKKAIKLYEKACNKYESLGCSNLGAL